MDIEIWYNDSDIRQMHGMFHSWTNLKHNAINIKICKPDWDYISNHVHSFSGGHWYVNERRTIAKINDKYIFFDATDRPGLSANSHLVPFSLIIKFQYSNLLDYYISSVSPVVPFTYILSFYNMNLIQECRQLREEILQHRKFATSIYWAGVYKNHPQRRPIQGMLNATKLGSCKKYFYDNYMKAMATTQVGIAVPGCGDFCYRDIELAAIGTPYVRKHFRNTTRNPRLPNVHYYSIGGDEVPFGQLLQHYIDYFEPNGELRPFTNEEWEMHCEISNNSMKWFDENSSPEGSFKLFCEILEEHNLI
jgi:hypothetical protein